MATEIEKRFLLTRAPDMGAIPATPILQGYLSEDRQRTVRIRRMGDSALLTVKGERINGVAPEFEYGLPVADADTMIETLCLSRITKNRYVVPAEEPGLKWEVDFFTGAHDGLVIAEIELPHPDTAFAIPQWLVGHEITDDARFANAVLARTDAQGVRDLVNEYRGRLPRATPLMLRPFV